MWGGRAIARRAPTLQERVALQHVLRRQRSGASAQACRTRKGTRGRLSELPVWVPCVTVSSELASDRRRPNLPKLGGTSNPRETSSDSFVLDSNNWGEGLARIRLGGLLHTVSLANCHQPVSLSAVLRAMALLCGRTRRWPSCARPFVFLKSWRTTPEGRFHNLPAEASPFCGPRRHDDAFAHDGLHTSVLCVFCTRFERGFCGTPRRPARSQQPNKRMTCSSKGRARQAFLAQAAVARRWFASTTPAHAPRCDVA